MASVNGPTFILFILVSPEPRMCQAQQTQQIKNEFWEWSFILISLSLCHLRREMALKSWNFKSFRNLIAGYLC